uniref:EFR3B n=1 Tax=Angiostrongylus cantonensis TaxID=6313 RepID=A0A0K0DMY1_ANGCA
LVSCVRQSQINVVLFGITQFIILHAQIKGARIIPLVSSISVYKEKMDADVNVYLSPEQEELANVMNFKRASSTASFASDLVSSLAASVTQTDSYDSSLSEPSGQEIDLDEEMEKVRLTEHLNTSEGSLRDEKEEEAQYRRARLSFREVANEVLTKMVDVGHEHVRSSIVWPSKETLTIS